MASPRLTVRRFDGTRGREVEVTAWLVEPPHPDSAGDSTASMASTANRSGRLLWRSVMVMAGHGLDATVL